MQAIDAIPHSNMWQ